MNANRAGAGVTSKLSKRGRTAGLLFAAVLVSLSTGAGAFELLTRNPASGVPQNGGLGNSSRPALTPDGRYVAFESTATNLVTPDSAGGSHIFLFDRSLNTLEQIDLGLGGVQPNGTSFRPSISSDGCKVAFESGASNLVAGDGNGSTDVFVRDRCLGQTTLASVSSGGIQGNLTSKNSNIAANGRYVAFESNASNLVASTNHGTGQVYRRDLLTSTTIRLSASISDGTGGGFGSGLPSISADGTRVAFWSFAADLVAGDTNNLWDVFLWDANGAPAVRMASTAPNGALRNLVNAAESASRIVEPGLSGDGRFVSFSTTSTDLLPGGSSGRQHVYVKDMLTGGIVRASVTSAGAEGSGNSPTGQAERASLSYDGTWVLFTTSAANLHRGGSGSVNLVARNIVTGQTRDFFPAPSFGLGERPAISGDLAGRFITFYSADSLDPRFASSGVFLGARATGLVIDFNQDGRSDITWRDPSGQAAMWLMDGTSVVGSSLILGSGNWVVRENDGDYNGDGYADLLWLNVIDGRWAIWLMNGTTPIGSALIFGGGGGWEVTNIGDFNGDGRTDLVWRDANGQVAMWLMNGLAPQASAIIFGGGTTWLVNKIGDFNGDGMSDLLFRDAGGQISMWLMNGLGVMNSGIIYGGGAFSVPIVGDFNGDGMSDLVLDDTSNQVAIWMMNGLTVQSSGIIYGGGAFRLRNRGDFNGDGKTDLVFNDPGGQVSIWLMDGLSVTGSAIVFGGGGGWQVIRASDFDGDGRSDLLWANAGGVVAVWMMNGTSPQATGVIFGGNGGWVVQPNDYVN